MQKIIDAIMWEFGFTRSEAFKYLIKFKDSDPRTIDVIVEGYEAHLKKSFYED